jgi:hypothetical protein
MIDEMGFEQNCQQEACILLNPARPRGILITSKRVEGLPDLLTESEMLATLILEPLLQLALC